MKHRLSRSPLVANYRLRAAGRRAAGVRAAGFAAPLAWISPALIEISSGFCVYESKVATTSTAESTAGGVFGAVFSVTAKSATFGVDAFASSDTASCSDVSEALTTTPDTFTSLPLIGANTLSASSAVPF